MRFLLAASCLLAAPLPCAAQDAVDGLVLSCPVCHGADSGAVPALEGRSAAELEALLRGFRDGSLEGASMPRLTRALSDADIRRLAAFYSRIKP